MEITNVHRIETRSKANRREAHANSSSKNNRERLKATSFFSQARWNDFDCEVEQERYGYIYHLLHSPLHQARFKLCAYRTFQRCRMIRYIYIYITCEIPDMCRELSMSIDKSSMYMYYSSYDRFLEIILCYKLEKKIQLWFLPRLGDRVLRKISRWYS